MFLAESVGQAALHCTNEKLPRTFVLRQLRLGSVVCAVATDLRILDS